MILLEQHPYATLAGATSALIALLILLHKLVARLQAEWRGRVHHPLRFQQMEFLSAEHLGAWVAGLARLLGWILDALLIWAYLGIAFGTFPATREWATDLLALIVNPAWEMLKAVVGYLPRLLVVLLIVLAARGILKVLRLVATGIEKRLIVLPGFHFYWAEPTYRLSRILVWIFALAIALPFLPGARSEGFKGISIMVGLLISLGGSGTVANLMGGVQLSFMSPYRVGDFIRIGDHEGTVVERNLLHTR
ncbi:MAG TPA: mechanosensitive ion channel domain-containing protein, partial [Holophagaceae bacterium]|nr:mechanosensitive ion channel domain-containing protein [Holophagaceae bacterium]